MTFLRNLSAAVLPDRAFHAARSAKSYFSMRSVLPLYVDLVRSTFPDIAFEQARLITTGFANVVLMLDRQWVFRFPRNRHRRQALASEISILARLDGQIGADIPHYTHLAPDGSFGGYRMLHGEELKPDLFRTLDRGAQETAVSQFAQLLSALHELPVDLAARGDRIHVGQSNAEFGAQYFSERRRVMARKLGPDMSLRLDRLYRDLPGLDSFAMRLINNDIDDDHLLWNRDSNRIGLIDFGDAAAGDPAIDFAMLWTYPDWVPAFVFDRYAPGAQDRGLPERARFHAARRMGDRLWYCLRREGHPRNLRDMIGAMDRQLALLGI